MPSGYPNIELNQSSTLGDPSVVMDGFDVMTMRMIDDYINANDCSSQIFEPQLNLEDVDPLFEFDKDEVLRLCHLYEEALGFVYPVLDLQQLMIHAESMVSATQQTRYGSYSGFVKSIDTLQLRIVLCCALAMEGDEQNKKAARVYSSITGAVNQVLEQGQKTVSYLAFLVLSAGYHLLSRQGVLAGQTIWRLARLCLRMNLHQKMGLLAISNTEEQEYALNVFWVTYAIDQQVAFNTGLPPIIREADIDTQLPVPDSHPYLAALVTWTRMGTKVWNRWPRASFSLPQSFVPRTVNALDNEVLRWYKELPEEMKLVNLQRGTTSISQTDAIGYPQSWICSKLLQMRIWLYVPVLSSRASIIANPDESRRAVNLAKDTIRFLNSLRDTACEQSIRAFYPDFLSSAIAILFLVSAYAPSQYVATCREDFYAAVDLTKLLTAKHWLSQRLWKAIGSLKLVASRFGIQFYGSEPLVTPGTANFLSDRIDSSIGGSNQVQGLNNSPSSLPGDLNGIQLWTELAVVFELYTRLGGFQSKETEDQYLYQSVNLSRMNETVHLDETVFLLFQDLIQGGALTGTCLQTGPR
ncbi:hypothetical protein DER46DRAFT_214793 [Fusarium sp. MPI-SDFR-AT-0072]|nr:hypothetical protein DER46DRAFT_214793 [Fusarium sp. MPI-SDFR-AT-0072]